MSHTQTVDTLLIRTTNNWPGPPWQQQRTQVAERHSTPGGGKRITGSRCHRQHQPRSIPVDRTDENSQGISAPA
jgi:hypothetical protein